MSVKETSLLTRPGRDAGAALRWGARGTAGATIAAGLKFENVYHAYDGNESIAGLSLEIAPGEVLCLLGHSGCGKTTLMRIAAGVERQASGRVLINGREVSGAGGFVPPERRGVGLMFQDYALFPHMTILDNVMFGLTNLPREAAKREALASLARVGLEGYAGDYPHALSGGEQQRVALARAIAPRPGVLLMDEPFSGLDRRLRDNVREETLAILRETRATCIIVTHDPEEAMRMGDRIALMRRGRLVQHGTADDLYNNPESIFVARFFSEVNQFTGTVADGGVDTPLGLLPGSGYNTGVKVDAGQKVDVCVRPQGILVGNPEEGGVVGRISSRRFVGEVDLLSIVVDGLDDPVHARVRAGGGYRAGMDVGLTTDPKDVLVFPAED
ncbi:ABC transporter ATP-binding protein [Roseibium aggregatum]|uniref:ABC transporter ATP-binding protein n=1 Tax=Roseibium aggregatum TaxID=187304 RepID=A0A926P356_9HYPH|nr:ABC transporter ATP-binding protein [Roseibium aggregatum]MBD1546296.1 ABC transporter ATP-binding protein [Roseibium aggregatum]